MMLSHIPILDVRARKVIDSRGNFTVEATVILDYSTGVCSAPSGASTGATEMKAFPKGGPDESISFLEKNLRDKLTGFNALDQAGLDALLRETDGSEYLSNLGGNMATAISIANAKAVASSLDIPLYRYVGGALASSLPRPMGNVIGGGRHSRNGTTIQEFLVSTQARTFIESAFINTRVHRRIGELLSEKLNGISVGVGDERAWTASIDDMEAVDIVKQAVKDISSEHKVKILLGVDFAATEYFKDGKYYYKNEVKSRDEQIDYAQYFAKDLGFYFVEDPIEDTDFEGFAEVTKRVRDRSVVVGDDLYTTNPDRLRKGIELNSSNGILIKVNQIGTLTSTQETVNMAREAGIRRTVSHRSGETTDDFIAHLSVAFGAEFIKTGTIGGERLAKLNELIRIEEDLI